ncbi:glycosyltransferase family 2 protein [Flavobacterium aquiphilum]|uniref:glycosyltransferase family 2 protein n=1 Tax=Flavobacterium aquiphilum TaxID=3003261 RepID=UPI0024811C1D|nr:glycosyltransferase family 2 protein [Flavobacterium aquiphilum]
MKKIAVVILNWNGVKLLEQFLPSVTQFSQEATIYVADNASTDESIQFVKNNYPEVKIIQNKSNKGFAGGYNEALQQVDEEIYALVNSDIEVTENWLNPIVKIFETEPATAIIQPKILDFKKKEYFEYAGAAGGFIDKFGYPFCRGRIFDTLEKDKGQYDDRIEIFWASGACFFIRSAVYKEMKGFDEDFFAHQEEIDLCWRTINKDYKIKYCPESIVYHVGGATLQQSNPKKTFLNFRNSLLMLTKNLPQDVLFQVLIVRLLLDGIAGVKFILEGQFAHCSAIIRAHFSFYGLFFRNYKKREKKQTKLYFKTKSVVYGYYVENGTVFANYF